MFQELELQISFSKSNHELSLECDNTYSESLEDFE